MLMELRKHINFWKQKNDLFQSRRLSLETIKQEIKHVFVADKFIIEFSISCMESQRTTNNADNFDALACDWANVQLILFPKFTTCNCRYTDDPNTCEYYGDNFQLE